MKGRPFAMLSSQRLPVPSTSLIDFNLISDLGLKMSDLQCSKFSYGGQKLRILGKISQMVQTITDGVISGTVHLRASVVEGLRTAFDSHSIAGKKFTELLQRKVSHTSPPASPASTPSSTSTRSSRSPATPKAAKVKSAPGQVRSPPPNIPTKPLLSPKPLQLPPPSPPSQEDDWLHGRISFVCGPPTNLKVGILYNDGCFTEEIITRQERIPEWCQPWLQSGDVVRFKIMNGDDPWFQPDFENDPPITNYRDETVIQQIYSKKEVAELRRKGILIPELPPEHYPVGYHGY